MPRQRRDVMASKMRPIRSGRVTRSHQMGLVRGISSWP